MGLLNQIFRTVNDYLRKIWNGLFHRGKKDEDEEIEVPASWQKAENTSPRPGRKNKKQIVVQKHKIRVPGLRWFKRALAGCLLFINFVFSQFLLSRVGDQGQSLFILFLLNSFIMADYLWKTRKAS
jgi:hypothetical protein